jgi:hypothetical protein
VQPALSGAANAPTDVVRRGHWEVCSLPRSKRPARRWRGHDWGVFTDAGGLAARRTQPGP